MGPIIVRDAFLGWIRSPGDHPGVMAAASPERPRLYLELHPCRGFSMESKAGGAFAVKYPGWPS